MSEGDRAADGGAPSAIQNGGSGWVAAGLVGMVLLQAVWLWPIGLGGKMPVGGDATAFGLGLMGRLSSALRGEADWPVDWADDWGYGFPGLAESQMGVYYPPNLLLYGSLPLEVAHTASLVIHLAWAGIGAWWAGRKLGASCAASWTAGLAWSCGGFFLVHLPHHWGATEAAWMPWAWGLAWGVARGDRYKRDACLLSLVMAVQVLIGHFQIAFETQASTLLVAALAWVSRGNEKRGKRAGWLAVAFVLGAGMAGLQWVPTARLAALAESDRSFEYLSGFAGTPLHLVNYVAPLLFHRSPLWRPVAWDPFHTSPEEWQPYVGLVTLLMASGALTGRWKDPVVRVMAIVAGVGLILSLGPYVPGFSIYCQWPGFSFFRAPARWSVVTGLAFALLAGQGLDRLLAGDWARFGRAALVWAMSAVLLPLLIVGLYEGALAESKAGQAGPVLSLMEAMGRWRPWPGDPGPSQVVLASRVNRVSQDVTIRYVQEGFPPPGRRGTSLERDRFWTYRAELTHGFAIAGLMIAACLIPWPRGRWLAVASLMAVDLLALGRHRGVESAPMSPVAQQSPVLGIIGSSGLRSLDSLQNLPMAAGGAPIRAYRTLDLPRPTWPRLAPDPADIRSWAGDVRALGAGVVVLAPGELGGVSLDQLREALPGRWAEVEDETLAGWLLGSRFVEFAGRPARTFRIWFPEEPGSRAWLIPATAIGSWKALAASTDRGTWLTALEHARPVEEHLGPTGGSRVAASADGRDVLVFSRTYDPQWQPNLQTALLGTTVAIEPVAGGWQAIRLPGPGRWEVDLRYEPRAERAGQTLGFLSLMGWASMVLVALAGHINRPAAGASVVEVTT